MKDNEKQIFTRREIETDLKNAAKELIYPLIFLFILSFGGSVFSVYVMLNDYKFSLFFFVIVMLQIAMTLGVTYFLIKYLIRYFKPSKYVIVSDVFVYGSTKTILLDNIACFSYLNFKTYGEFGIDYGRSVSAEAGFPAIEGRWFYKWSFACKTTPKGLRQSSFPGDEFYLIIINNKIRYVYNKKIFEFKETEKA